MCGTVLCCIAVLRVVTQRSSPPQLWEERCVHCKERLWSGLVVQTDRGRQFLYFFPFFRLNANNVNPAPLLMWNNVLHYSGLNPVIAGAPFVGRGGPHQLPWLQNVVVFPRISAIALDMNRFPVGLGVPSNFGQSNPLFGYDQVINICPACSGEVPLPCKRLDLRVTRVNT